MASPFDGLGMQFMGKERQHMGAGPFGEIAKLLPAGLVGYGLYKSGAVDNLNDMFNPKKTITNKIAGALAPDQATDIGVPPVKGGPMSVPSLTMINDAKEALDAQSPQNVPVNQLQQSDDNDNLLNDVIPFTSSSSAPISLQPQALVSPDPLKIRDPAQDQAIINAQAVAPPSLNVGQGQMNKDSEGGGASLLDIAKLIMTFA